MATRTHSGFVNDDLDALQADVSLEQVCMFYGVETGELREIGAEIRARCFLNCGKDAPTGDRALAIRSDGVKRWHCHEYECGKGGNLIGLCNYLAEGVPDDGQPRGLRFKQILLDLKIPRICVLGSCQPKYRADMAARLTSKENERTLLSEASRKSECSCAVS